MHALSTAYPAPADRPTAEEAALEAAILRGFADRHRSKHHAEESIASEIYGVAQFRLFAGAPPWRWTNLHMDRYGGRLRQGGYALATMRSRQGAVKRFLDYARHPGYSWDEQCYQLTGLRIPQICTWENTIAHQHGAATSKRRNLLDAELERLAQAVREEAASASRTRFWTARATHLAILHFTIAFGLRESEVAMGDLADLSPAVSPEIRAFSAFEDFSVRFGKSHNGSEKKQRVVPAIYLFKDSLRVVEWYLREIRPYFVRKHRQDAIFLGCRGERFRADSLSQIFARYRDLASLSTDLTMHCLRHTFATRLHEAGYPLSLIAHLLGHESDATTGVYDHMRDETVKADLLYYQAHLTDDIRMVRDDDAAFERLLESDFNESCARGVAQRRGKT